MLIVCGSATSWMIRSVLKNKGGLFNRANRVIYLKPFCLAECEAYMRERGVVMGRRELIEGYMVFGGSFERVCMLHEDALKFALGISGVSAEVGSWRSERKKGGAQIDLLIDRRDGIVNVCEMKFAADDYEITEEYERKLRHKLALFKEESGTRKSVHLTFVSTYGLKRNSHSGVVQSEIKLDDLFALPPHM